MDIPSPARLDLSALLHFIDECIEYFDFKASVTVREDRGREFRMLFGICVQIARLARARKVLVGAGLAIEARILVRSALEYAATAQYCYFRADGLDRLGKSISIEERELFERLAEWTKIEDYLVLRDNVTVPDVPKGLPYVSQINDLLDPEKVFFQQAYKVLCQTTHVTSAALKQYFVVDPENRQNWSLNHHASEDQFEPLTVFALAMSAMTATWIIADTLGDAAMLDLLDDRSEVLSIPVRFDYAWSPETRARPE